MGDIENKSSGMLVLQEDYGKIVSISQILSNTVTFYETIVWPVAIIVIKSNDFCTQDNNIYSCGVYDGALWVTFIGSSVMMFAQSMVGIAILNITRKEHGIAGCFSALYHSPLMFACVVFKPNHRVDVTDIPFFQRDKEGNSLWLVSHMIMGIYEFLYLISIVILIVLGYHWKPQNGAEVESGILAFSFLMVIFLKSAVVEWCSIVSKFRYIWKKDESNEVIAIHKGYKQNALSETLTCIIISCLCISSISLGVAVIFIDFAYSLQPSWL